MSLQDDMKTYAVLNHVPVMQDDGLMVLLDAVEENDCSSFLELGTAIAKTAILIASIREDMRVVTIERDPKMIMAAKENIERSGVKDRITLVEGDALLIEGIEGPFDCIFIDAAKAQYQRFFEKYSPLLSENGIIVSDNMNFHGLVAHPERTNNRNTRSLVKKLAGYHEYLKNLNDYETIFYDLGDGVAITRRKK